MARTALVLGGGGVSGIGWSAGILHGLALAGADVTGADTVIGTSAGSVVAAQVTSGLLTPEELYERQLGEPIGEMAVQLSAGDFIKYARATLSSRTPEAYGRKVGRFALDADTPEEAVRREVVEGRLISHDWPQRPMLVTAVDTATGELHVFDRGSGVPVVDAVTASCAVPGVWPAHTVEGRRFMDGGTHSPANAHLAAGHDRVVIIAPIGSGGGSLASAGTQGARLAEAGARVSVITPDRAVRKILGRNNLDPTRRAPAARAGLAQAAALAAEVARVWRD